MAKEKKPPKRIATQKQIDVLRKHKRENWEPGKSGNPLGKAPGTKNRSTVYRAFFEMIPRDADGKVMTSAFGNIVAPKGMTVEEVLAAKMIAIAMDGSETAIEKAFDNVYGKSKEVHEITGKDGQPLQAPPTVVSAKKLSTQELAQLYRDACKGKRK